MTLYDELYFDITIEGSKSELRKFISAVKNGALDDFFEDGADYLDFSDDYTDAEDSKNTVIYLTNQDYGIEIDEIDVADFLEELCKNCKNLELRGEVYDADDDAYRFVSEKGDPYYVNADKAKIFNDDTLVEKEEDDEEDSEGED